MHAARELMKVDVHRAMHRVGVTPGTSAAARCAEAFNRIDVDRDGRLSRTEILLACIRDASVRELLSLPASIGYEGPARECFESIFRRLDSDHSGAVSLQEFTSF